MAKKKSKFDSIKELITPNIIKKLFNTNSSRLEIIELLDKYSGSFEYWKEYIRNALIYDLADKINADGNFERKNQTLEDFTDLCNKLIEHKDIFAEWHRSLLANDVLTENLKETVLAK